MIFQHTPAMPGENTLRPYYNHDTFDAGYLVIFQPGIGLVDTASNKPISAHLGNGLSSASGNFGTHGIGLLGLGRAGTLNLSLPLSDKNYVYDLELLEYFDGNNLLELFKNLVWNFVRNYCKVLISQPLDISRLVLQVGYFDFSEATATSEKAPKHPRLKNDLDGSSHLTSLESSSDEYEEDIDYFQLPWESSNAPNKTVSPQKNSKRSTKSVSHLRKIRNPNKIHPISQHTIDIMTSIASKDGPFALFRGINASFIHYTLSHTIEAWITGFLSPFLSIPDPFFLDLTHSTEPGKSLWLSVLACVLAGVVLMPLDLIKVRLMITQFNKPAPTPAPSDLETSSVSCVASATEESNVDTRSVRESIRHFPKAVLLSPPPTITLLTIFHQFSTTVFRKLAPYLLFVRYNIDSYLSPNLYTMANLLLLITELFIKLPLENLLRKEQVRFLLKPKSEEEDKYGVVTIKNPEENLIVNFNGFNPHNSFESPGGETGSVGLWQRFRLLGLFNGWRVGVLNVIGFWGYNIFKSSGVLAEERL